LFILLKVYIDSPAGLDEDIVAFYCCCTLLLTLKWKLIFIRTCYTNYRR